MRVLRGEAVGVGGDGVGADGDGGGGVAAVGAGGEAALVAGLVIVDEDAVRWRRRLRWGR